MGRITKGAVAGLVALSLSSGASAQSLRSFENDGRNETRAMVGITIPFGGDRRSAENKPRVDFRMQSAEIGSSYDLEQVRNPLLLDRRDVRQATVSLTFEDNPRFLLNGRSLSPKPLLRAAQDGDEEASAEGEENTEEKKDRTTGEKVLRGAAFSALAAVTVAAGAFTYFLARCGDGSCSE